MIDKEAENEQKSKNDESHVLIEQHKNFVKESYLREHLSIETDNFLGIFFSKLSLVL